MTNTYKDSDSMEYKMYQEMRCVRCVLERILRVMDEGLFVDYQMEKFGKDYKQSREMGEPKIRSRVFFKGDPNQKEPVLEE